MILHLLGTALASPRALSEAPQCGLSAHAGPSTSAGPYTGTQEVFYRNGTYVITATQMHHNLVSGGEIGRASCRERV